MQLQLWKTDEYGQGSIEATSGSVEELVKLAKSKVTEDNVNNPLSVDFKNQEWESSFVELYDYDEDELIEGAVYSGLSTTGHHSVVDLEDGQIYKLEDTNGSAKFFLGVLDRKDWYLTDPRTGDFVKEFDKVDMRGRSIYYIRTLRQPKA